MSMENPPLQAARPDDPNSIFDSNDPFYDFKYDTLVDPNDPGFDVDYDTSSIPSSDEEGDSDDDENDFVQNTDTELRSLTRTLETEFLKQPKSTQLILTHEVSQLFKSYQQHGSAARLSVSIMAFLDGGDIALRNAKRDIVEEEYDPKGERTGRTRVVKKDVVERAKLRFCPLPRIGVSETERLMREKLRLDGRGKRKAENEIKGFGKRERVGEFGGMLPSFRERGSPVRPRTAGKVFPGDVMDVDGSSLITGNSGLMNGFSNILNHPGPQNQQPAYHTMYPARSFPQHQQHYPIEPRTDKCNTPQFQPIANRLTPQYQSSTTHHLSSPTPPTNPPIPPDQYSLTTDHETQSQLLTLPFNPLVNLTIPFPQTPETPSSIPSIITRIINLHSHAAQHLHSSLLDKYTLPDTQPPAALIRLGITAKLHSQLSTMFEATTDNEFAIDPEARALMKQLYDVKPGELNGLETQVVARMCALDRESVESWWEKKANELVPWVALRIWVERVEAAKIDVAKTLGLY